MSNAAHDLSRRCQTLTWDQIQVRRDVRAGRGGFFCSININVGPRPCPSLEFWPTVFDFDTTVIKQMPFNARADIFEGMYTVVNISDSHVRHISISELVKLSRLNFECDCVSWFGVCVVLLIDHRPWRSSRRPSRQALLRLPLQRARRRPPLPARLRSPRPPPCPDPRLCPTQPFW